MKFAMFYDVAPAGLARIQANFVADQNRLREFHQDGTPLMAGPCGSPPLGAVAVFTSREAAEAFVAGDPFVLNGVVGKYSIHEWSEVLGA